MATSAPSIFPALAQLDIGDVLAHMPGGFFVYHADGDEAVVYVNEACLRIFGCADEEQFVALTGGAFPGMVHPEDIEAVEHSISRQIQADRYSMDYVEYRIIRRDGSVRWIEDYGHHVTLDAGEFFYVFINDATDKLRERADELEAVNAQLREAYARELEHRTMLRNALSEAEAANVAKNTFLSNMSHDIRTPLNAVVGYASLISAHGGEAERVRAYSDKVLAASEQLLDVVNETLEISRMEAGHVQLAEAECSLSELVLQARMDMVDLADRADVTLACDIEPLAHDRVLVDAVRLSHVLTQLVDNAIKYSPAGSTVRISVAENAGAPQGFASFRFVVADKGVGMEPAFMERMFMPFERESNTTASGVQGTGLGLTIVRNVLDLMEGELAVESAPGEGSTFTVDITFRQAPADVAAEAPRPGPGAPHSARGGQRAQPRDRLLSSGRRGLCGGHGGKRRGGRGDDRGGRCVRLRLGAHGHSDAGHGRLCRHPRHSRAARPAARIAAHHRRERQRVFRGSQALPGKRHGRAPSQAA